MERRYGMSVGVAGWVGLILAFLLQAPINPVILVVLMAGASLAEYWPAKLRVGTISILTAFIIPSVVITGPVGTAAMLVVSSLVAAVSHRRPIFFGFFNGGQFALSALLARLLTGLVPGVHLGGAPADFGWLILYYVLFLLINHLLVDSYFLLAGYSWRAVVWEGLILDLLQSVISVPLGFAMIYADYNFGWPGIVGVALPVILFGYALQLQTDLSNRNRNLETIYGLQATFSRASGVSEILEILRESIAGSLQAHAQHAAALVGRSELLALPGSTMSPPEGLLRTVLENRRPEILEGVARAGLVQPGARSAVMLPVASTERNFGILTFAWPDQRAFGQQDEHLLGASAQIAALACEKEELLRETERLAATDPRLPGLYNHRYFMDRLAEEIGRLERESSVLSLVYIDLDGFKSCNDRYGHLAGDEALREFAAILRSHTRECDVAARYAGDEFVLLLPDADEELAEGVARRLREEVEAYRFLREESDGGVPLSFSYGTATTRAVDADPRGILSLADRAMYRDKADAHSGNRLAPRREGI